MADCSASSRCSRSSIDVEVPCALASVADIASAVTTIGLRNDMA
jgi:hypothetical protein